MAQHSVPNRQARRPHGIFPVGGSTTVIEEDRKENTVWDVYNNEARKVDIELVKDWSENLNSLLVFAAIFAAVLTAFVIESKSLLEPDQGEILVDLAILFFNELRNASSATNATISRPDFTPTSEAITINCLLFGSLGASLFAALASVVALQWVGDYDAAITRGGSSPEDRAKRRQFHYAGVVDWKMGEIIALLPVLLYASVALFWAGLVLWIWTVHRTVAAVVMGGTVLAAVFYVTTTLLAAIFVSSPFRTPLSRGVYWACQPFVSLVHRILRSRLFLHLIYSTKESLRITAPVLIQPPPQMTKMYTEYLPQSKFITWLQHYILPQDTAARREERYLDRDPLLGQEALCWLANQVSISENSHYRLLLLVGEFQTYACQEKVSPYLAKAPWWKIFDCLGWYHLRRTFDCALIDEDKGAVEILLQCVTVKTIKDEVLAPLEYQPNLSSFTGGSEYDRKLNAVFLLVSEISDTLHQETMKPWYPEVRKAVSSVLRTLVNHGELVSK
ncbi:hypothetical protein CPB86DRAFT_710945 [Serendipita vermifera]|nr:hypothetical protein CPB86DRAFT_710945 [Serendipita vermifera]